MQTYGACRMRSVTKQHDSSLVPRLELWPIIETVLPTNKLTLECLFHTAMIQDTATYLDEFLRHLDQFTGSVIPAGVLRALKFLQNMLFGGLPSLLKLLLRQSEPVNKRLPEY